jgi:hypothetical protein
MSERYDTRGWQAYLEQVQIDRSFISQLCILYYSDMPERTLEDISTFIIANGSLWAQSNMLDTGQARQIHTYSVMN